jgi:hypothetical protein
VDLSGKIKATSGEIGGFTITNNSIYSGASSWGGTGTYLGSSGFSLKGSRGAIKIDSNGITEIETSNNYPLKVTASGYSMYSYVGYAELGLVGGSTLYTKLGNSKLEVVNSSYSSTLDWSELTIKSSSTQSVFKYNGITATSQGNTGYTVSSDTNLYIKSGSLSYKVYIQGGGVVICDGVADTLGFFGNNGASKQTVGDLTATPTLDNLKSKLNSLIDALQAYNLIG